MNEYAIIIVSIISVLGTIGAIQVMQRNWYRREEIKYKYDVKRARLRQKGKQIAARSPSGAGDWIDKLKGLNPDTINSILDFVSGSEEQPENIDELAQLLPLAKGFLQGYQGKKETEDKEVHYQS